MELTADLAAFIARQKSEVLVCALVLARIGPLVLFAPAIGGSVVPLRLRLALAVCVSVLVLPLHLSVSKEAATVIESFPMSLVSEALIGSSIALALACLVAGLHTAGQLVGSMSGLSLARVSGNEGQAAVPVVGRALEVVALSVFLLGGGHRLVLDALLDTFRWAPVGRMPITEQFVLSTLTFAGHIFLVAIKVAAPIAASVLLAIVVVGLLSRAVPQMNTFSVGLGLNAIVVLAMLSLSLGGTAWIFRNEAETAVETFRAAISAAQESQ